MKKAAVLFVATLVALAGLYYYAWRQYESFLDTPLDIPPQGHLFSLNLGSNG